MNSYDVIFIGGGPAGYVGAIRGAQLGGKICVVEYDEPGGTCILRGCIPTKTLVHYTKIYHYIKNSEKFGITISGDVTPDLMKMMEKKSVVVNNLVKGIHGLFKSNGVDFIYGKASFIEKNKLKVTGNDGTVEEISGKKIIICTGSVPANIPVFPFKKNKIFSSDNALELTEIPESILIVGAGVIGCEFAFILKYLGSEVTIVEMLPNAVPLEDTDISKTLERELKKNKIKLHTSKKVEKVIERDDGKLESVLDTGDTIVTDKILVSIGRVPNTSGLDLEKVGVETGKRGEILVNERMETNLEDVYAAGDVIGGYMLAYVASKEAEVAVENALGKDRTMSYSVVPACTFTNPEIASVGMKERDAVEKDIEINIGRFHFRILGKAQAIGEIAGEIKIIADKKTDKILGVHIIGPHATDLIQEAVIAMEAGVTALEMGEALHCHPVLAEGMMEAALDVHDRAIHIPKKG